MSQNPNSVLNSLRDKLIETGTSATEAEQIIGQITQVSDLEKLNSQLLLIAVLAYNELSSIEDDLTTEIVYNTIKEQLSRRWEDWKSVPLKNKRKLSFEVLAFLFKIDQEFPSSQEILPV